MSEPETAADIARKEAARQLVGVLALAAGIAIAVLGERALSGPDVLHTARLWWIHKRETFCRAQADWWAAKADRAHTDYREATL